MRKSGKIRSVAENFSPMMLTPQVGASSNKLACSGVRLGPNFSDDLWSSSKLVVESFAL